MRYEDLEPKQTIVWAVREGVITKAYRDGSALVPTEQEPQTGEEHGSE